MNLKIAVPHLESLRRSYEGKAVIAANRTVTALEATATQELTQDCLAASRQEGFTA
jgi:hypothetical protein